jgi:hypothetical protein
MSHKKLTVDVDAERRHRYMELESQGGVQKALWAALARLNEQGIDIGPEAVAVLAKRETIKTKVPKKK